jgi:NAD(P)H dehydrogenase (quinone)
MITSSKPRILVTGATGGVGTPLVSELLAKGFPVRAVVRTRDARSAQLEKRGAEVVIADLYDPDQLTLAARGAQRAFYLPPIRPYMIQSAVAFAVAAREAKLEHVVEMSQWTSHRAHRANMTRQTWLVDQLFSMVPGVAHTVFNPGMFAHNFLRTIDYTALLGIYPVLSGKGKAAPISNEDMARVAAVLLAEGPERHAGKSYRPTGPQLLDGRDMAAMVARAVGHRVFPVDMPIWMLSKVAQQQGVDPYEISSLRHYMQDMRKGTFEFEGGVTNVVEELSGAPAESFETTARRYAALPYARQTIGARVKAFINFNLAPFYPGYNFDKWDKKMAFPSAPNSSLSIEDERWRREHAAQMADHREPPLKAAPLMRAV